MPGIHRRSRIGILDVTHLQDDKPPIYYCSKCEEEGGTLSVLGPRIYPDLKIAPLDAENWKQCNLCGTIYGEPEVRGEGELSIQDDFELANSKFEFGKTILKPVLESRKFDKTGQQQKNKKKKRKYELEQIKDKDLRLEIEKGGKVTSYSVTKG